MCAHSRNAYSIKAWPLHGIYLQQYNQNCFHCVQYGKYDSIKLVPSTTTFFQSVDKSTSNCSPLMILVIRNNTIGHVYMQMHMTVLHVLLEMLIVMYA